MNFGRKNITRSYRVAKYIVYKETIISPVDHIRTFIGAFLGIGIIGFMQSNLFSPNDTLFLIGSFGASAVLVFGSSNSPLAQPRNLILGHCFSAIIGVSFQKLIPGELWLSASLSVATSIVVMQITKSMHPPGGATALIANIGSEKIKLLGFHYILSPVLSGVLILLIVALVINNFPKRNNYPYKKNTKMKIIPFLLLFILASCANNSKKGEEILLKDLSKATKIIASKNDRRFEKLKTIFEKDTTNADIKKLYRQFSIIHEQKNIYLKALGQSNDKDFEIISKNFISNCSNQLTIEEQKIINNSFKDSPIMNTSLLKEAENPIILSSELILDAEMYVSEIGQLILTDLSKQNKGFDWEIYWE